MVAPRQEALLAQMRRGTLQYCVLALLTEGERYGFELVRELAEVDGMVTSEGTIYPLLSRLRRDGLVESLMSAAAPVREERRPAAVDVAGVEGRLGRRVL